MTLKKRIVWLYSLQNGLFEQCIILDIDCTFSALTDLHVAETLRCMLHCLCK